MKFNRYFYKNLRKSTFVTLGISCIILFVLLMNAIINYSKDNILELNNSLSDNYINISLYRNNKVNIETIMKIKDIILKNNDGVLFGAGILTEGIYFNETYKHSYNLLEGRFFNKEDFNKGKKLAVVGKDIEEKVKIENGKKYISRGDEKYEVIGIMGKNNGESTYDTLLIYNIDSIIQDELLIPKNNWKVDSYSKSEKELIDIVNRINKNQPKDKLEISIMPKEGKPNPLKASIEDNGYIIINILIIVVCVLLSLIKAILFWINNMRMELGIRKLNGGTNIQMMLLVIKRYLIISFFSSFISMILYKIMTVFNVIDKKYLMFNLSNFILLIFLLLIIGILVVVTSLYRINKIQLSNVLKGK